MKRSARSLAIGATAVGALLVTACGHGVAPGPTTDVEARAVVQASPVQQSTPQASVAPADQAPPASQTGGFDGANAFAHVAQLVSFGPHPPASDGIHRAQDYITAQLKGFGCAVDADDFHALTPIGDLAMKNIVAKIPGQGQGTILLLTHYDTLRMDNFVGAEDGGSSTGLMLEMARLLCGAAKQPNSVWIGFLDGEEAQVAWTNADSVYGSRELAARLAVSGDLKRVRAVILADMIGQKGLQIPRDSNSTRWLADLVWKTAARLGYGNVFVSRDAGAIQDDHLPFIHRGVPAVDLIELQGYIDLGYWHTPQDTLDKVSPRSLATVGRVILESVSELQKP